MTNLDSMALQRSFWNQWNASTREHTFQDVSQRQTEVVCGWLEGLHRNDLDIIDAGCGTGWLCPKLLSFGHVTGTDLSDEVLARAQQREPSVKYIAGDFFALDLEEASFDVVVTLELLSHVADQAALLRNSFASSDQAAISCWPLRTGQLSSATTPFHRLPTASSADGSTRLNSATCCRSTSMCSSFFP